jgi:hypothetical protein
MSEIQTPRTDAKAESILVEIGPNNNARLATMADFARELEREAKKLELHVAQLRCALINALDSTQDDDGMWIDRDGDYVDALNQTK